MGPIYKKAIAKCWPAACLKERRQAEAKRNELSMFQGTDVPAKMAVSKTSSSRSSREKSPGVSFAEEVFDFEERQYQTVHAGLD